MRKTATRALLASIFVCFIACSKDNNSNSSALSGNWTFMGIHAQTSATISDDNGTTVLKNVTESEYTTTDNGGTVNVSGNTMTGTGITYAADMLIFVTEYEDGVILDTFSTTMPFTLPPTNSTATFEIIGTDSIHYTGGSMLGSAGTGTPAATGAKFAISGDILTLTSNVVMDKVTDTLGELITEHETAKVIATLKKQ